MRLRKPKRDSADTDGTREGKVSRRSCKKLTKFSILIDNFADMPTLPFCEKAFQNKKYFLKVDKNHISKSYYLLKSRKCWRCRSSLRSVR